MLKTKYALSALGLLVAMTMATDALAQGIFTATSSRTVVRMNGQAELVGGITLMPQTGTAIVDGGTITIDYGFPITNPLATVDESNANALTSRGIEVKICSATNFSDTGISISGNTLDIVVPSDADACAGGIDVDNVRLAIAGSGVEQISASIAANGDLRLGSGANEVPVVSAVVDELTDGGVTTVAGRTDTKLTLIRHTGIAMGGAAAQFHLIITENSKNAFDGARLNLEFDGIPAEATLTLDAWINPGGEGSLDAPVAVDPDFVMDDNPDTDDVADNLANTASTQVSFHAGATNTPDLEVDVDAEDNEVVVLMYYREMDDDDFDVVDAGDDVDESTLGGMLRPNEVDKVVIRGSFAIGDAETPLGDVDITVSVDVGPEGDAYEDGDEIDPKSDIPRFASDPTTPVTVIDVTSDKTTLVAPYALATQGFDTGFAISNMNRDSEQAGAITFMLFQNGDEPIEYTTSAGSPGRGLTSGMLEAGTTYAVLLTEILAAAGVSDGFSGYLEIITDFTNADGIAYISDWAAFSATATLEEKTGN